MRSDEDMGKSRRFFDNERIKKAFQESAPERLIYNDVSLMR